MTINLAQRFFLGVLMITPSDLRLAITRNITAAGNTGTAEPSDVFAQALLKALADGVLGPELALLLPTEITMSPLLSEAALIALFQRLGDTDLGQGLSPTDSGHLFNLYTSGAGDPVKQTASFLLDLVGYTGPTCPKPPDEQFIYKSLALLHFQTDAPAAAMPQTA
jgi:hypothetical protein